MYDGSNSVAKLNERPALFSDMCFINVPSKCMEIRFNERHWGRRLEALASILQNVAGDPHMQAKGYELVAWNMVMCVSVECIVICLDGGACR